MMSINIHDCVLNSAQNRVLNEDYFNQAEVDYFSRAPKHIVTDHLQLAEIDTSIRELWFPGTYQNEKRAG
jgi:hypothetical protein